MSICLTDDKLTLVQVRLGAVRQQTITWANVRPDLCRHMASLGHNELTHMRLNKMANILQTTYSNTFSWTKKKHIFLKALLKLAPGVHYWQIPVVTIGLDNGMVLIRWQAINYLNQLWPWSWMPYGITKLQYLTLYVQNFFQET